MSEPYCKCFPSTVQWVPIIIYILWTRKLRLREVGDLPKVTQLECQSGWSSLSS